MSSRTEALLFVLVAPAILTEVASGNTPVHALLDLRVTLFLILAYGFPVLVIRELSLRWRLSTAGIFLLGVAYGIVNEGLLAQTLVRYEHVPIDTFDRYIYVAGFNLSWASVILPWHAVFAVLFPLVLAALWFPSSAQHLWTSKSVFGLLSGGLIALLVFVSLARTPRLQMLVCLLAIAALICGSSVFRNRASFAASTCGHSRTTAFLFGLFSYPAFVLGSIVLAVRRVPAPLFFLFVFAVLFSLATVSRLKGLLRAPAAPYLALGSYCSMALFHLLVGVSHHAAEDIVTGAVLATTFLLSSRHRPSPGTLCP